MSESNVGTTFTAYFDDSGEPTDMGQRYSVIAAVLIREELHDSVDLQGQNVWERYMEGIDRTEFHATEIEGAKGLFSHLNGDGSLDMQKEFIRTISLLDLPALAVTVDNTIIRSNTIFGSYLGRYNTKVLATSLVIASIVGTFLDVSKGEHCRLVADRGLIDPKYKGVLNEALELMGAGGGRKASNLIEKLGFASSDALGKFLIDAGMPQIESHKSVGIQLADHVARYVFRHSREPGGLEPRYVALCEAGLKELPLNQNGEVAKFFLGLNIHMRLGGSVVVAPKSMGRMVTPMDLEKTIIPEFEQMLKSELSGSFACPNPECKVNLFWGCPTPKIQDAADKRQLLLCGERIRDNNYCPLCGALVFTKSELVRQWMDNMGRPKGRE